MSCRISIIPQFNCFDGLPTAVNEHIFSFLPISDQEEAGTSCQTLHRINELASTKIVQKLTSQQAHPYAKLIVQSCLDAGFSSTRALREAAKIMVISCRISDLVRTKRWLVCRDQGKFRDAALVFSLQSGEYGLSSLNEMNGYADKLNLYSLFLYGVYFQFEPILNQISFENLYKNSDDFLFLHCSMAQMGNEMMWEKITQYKKPDKSTLFWSLTNLFIQQRKVNSHFFQKIKEKILSEEPNDDDEHFNWIYNFFHRGEAELPPGNEGETVSALKCNLLLMQPPSERAKEVISLYAGPDRLSAQDVLFFASQSGRSEWIRFILDRWAAEIPATFYPNIEKYGEEPPFSLHLALLNAANRGEKRMVRELVSHPQMSSPLIEHVLRFIRLAGPAPDRPLARGDCLSYFTERPNRQELEEIEDVLETALMLLPKPVQQQEAPAEPVMAAAPGDDEAAPAPPGPQPLEIAAPALDLPVAPSNECCCTIL